MQSGIDDQSHSSLTIVQAQYVSDYFYSLALGLSKISILLLLHKLMPERLHKRLALATCAFAALWTFATLLALALRCAPHLPWSIPESEVQGSCMNLHTFWIANLPFDIISEIMMLALPVLMMIPVQVAVSKKVVIVVAFAFRLVLVAVTAVRIIYVPNFLPSFNFTMRSVNFFILTQTTISVAITTSCIPCLKPFLDAFDSGQMGVKFKDGHPGSLSGSRTYPMRNLDYGNQLAYGKNSAIRSHISAHGAQDEDEIVPAKRYGGRRQRAPSTEKKPPSVVGRQVSTDDSNSITSEAKSDQMIIRKNTTWTVQYEDMERPVDTFPAHASSRSHLDDDSGEDEKARNGYLK